MESNLRSPLTARFAQCCALLALATASVAAQAQSAGVAPEAKQILKASTDFLASQQRFSADTRNTLEIVLKSGQKIEFNSTPITCTVRMPARLSISATSVAPVRSSAMQPRLV